MKKRRTNKALRRAKGSLGKMLEILAPYLPKKQIVVPEATQNWKLPENDYGTVGVTHLLRPSLR